MDRKIAGIGIGAMLVISLVAIMGFAFAQNSNIAPATGFVDADGDEVCDNFADVDGDSICDHKGQRDGFADADNDGVCDNAENCPMHQDNKRSMQKDHNKRMGGCHGSEGCPKIKEGFKRGCHRVTTE